MSRRTLQLSVAFAHAHAHAHAQAHLTHDLKLQTTQWNLHTACLYTASIICLQTSKHNENLQKADGFKVTPKRLVEKESDNTQNESNSLTHPYVFQDKLSAPIIQNCIFGVTSKSAEFDGKAGKSFYSVNPRKFGGLPKVCGGILSAVNVVAGAELELGLCCALQENSTGNSSNALSRACHQGAFRIRASRERLRVCAPGDI